MTELQQIIERMEDTFDGQPWYGKAVLKVFNEINPAIVYKKPNGQSHSLIDLLYHMLTWQTFALQQLTEPNKIDPQEVERLDWREIVPKIHTWEAGVSAYTQAHRKLIAFLKNAKDDLLEGSVKYRDYNMRTLLKGITEHNVYHIGQVAYLKKQLEGLPL